MAVFRELTGNINFIDVTSLPTTDIKDQVIYRLAKGNQYLFYTYNKNVSKWIQIDKSVLVVTTTAEMLNDTTKTYYLNQVNGENQIGYYVVLNNTPTRLVTTKDIEDIKSTVNTANQNASSALKKATTAETNATTALSTANNASSTASNANSVATTANTTANTAKEKADSADTKADTAISTANEALNKANAVASVYRPQPSVESLADLPKPSAITANNVYNIKSAFVTNADFIEGAGVPYPAGTNVAVVLDNYTYKYDSLAGFVDLSNYQEKLKSGENIKTVNGQSILGSGDLQVESGSDVIANPTLAGTEEKLTGLQVGETKYSVGDIGEITIEQTQMLSETQIQLTEAQTDILKEFNFVYVKVPFLNLEQLILKYNQNDTEIVFVSIAFVNADAEVKTTDYTVYLNENIVTFGEYRTQTVIANAPNATQELGTLRVGDTVYSIPKGMQVIEIANNTTGTLTDANIATLQNNYPNVCIKQSDRRVLFPRGQGTGAYYFTALDSPSSNSFSIVDMVIFISTKQYNITFRNYNSLPTVTASDSGKFLTVNSSGQWVATTVPNAETTSF